MKVAWLLWFFFSLLEAYTGDSFDKKTHRFPGFSIRFPGFSSVFCVFGSWKPRTDSYHLSAGPVSCSRHKPLNRHTSYYKAGTGWQKLSILGCLCQGREGKLLSQRRRLLWTRHWLGDRRASSVFELGSLCLSHGSCMLYASAFQRRTYDLRNWVYLTSFGPVGCSFASLARSSSLASWHCTSISCSLKQLLMFSLV